MNKKIEKMFKLAVSKFSKESPKNAELRTMAIQEWGSNKATFYIEYTLDGVYSDMYVTVELDG